MLNSQTLVDRSEVAVTVLSDGTVRARVGEHDLAMTLATASRLQANLADKLAMLARLINA
jgi:hypothetical protein